MTLPILIFGIGGVLFYILIKKAVTIPGEGVYNRIALLDENTEQWVESDMVQEAERVTYPGWTIVRLLGEGSFGGVYEIERILPDGTVERAALKKLTIPQDPMEIKELYTQNYDSASITAHYREQMQDLMREYTFMRELSQNPYIVHCQDLQTVQHDDGIGWDIYIRMELLTPLKHWLKDRYDERTVIRLGLNLCGALDGCHARNILHRDIKPENILVTEDGHFKLGDFGIAKISEKTATGTLTGTYSYMAPEVANRRHYGTAADIYSLGMVLYWMMNERTLPFLPLNRKIPSGVQRQEAQDRRFSGEEIPAPVNGSLKLSEIVLKACAFSPEERYRTVQKLAEDLRGLVQKKAPEEPDEDTEDLSEAPDSSSFISGWLAMAARRIAELKARLENKRTLLTILAIGAGDLLLLVLCVNVLQAAIQSKKAATTPITWTETVFTESAASETMPPETTADQIVCERVYLEEEVPTLTEQGQNYLLYVRTVPEDVPLKRYFQSSDPSVVTVDENGLLRAQGNGTTQITITCGNASAVYPVTVEYSILKQDKQSTAAVDPSYIRINSFEDLDNIRNDLSGHYVLMQDLDLTDAPALRPIGEGSFAYSKWSAEGGFTGTLDGRGYKITGLKIQSNRQCSGLFTSIAAEGTVRNLTVEAQVTANVENDNNAIGGIAGYNEGTIENCLVDVNITGQGKFIMAAGIAGCNGGTIRYCQAEGFIAAAGEIPKVASIVSELIGDWSVSECVALVRNGNSPARLRPLAVDEGKTTMLLRTQNYDASGNPIGMTGPEYRQSTYFQTTLGDSFQNAEKINEALGNARAEALETVHEKLFYFENHQPVAYGSAVRSYYCALTSNNWRVVSFLIQDRRTLPGEDGTWRKMRTAYAGVTFDTETGAELSLGQVLGLPEAEAWQKAYDAAEYFLDAVSREGITVRRNSAEGPAFYLQDGQVVLILGGQLIPTGLTCVIS